MAIEREQYFRMKKKLKEGYPNYTTNFLLELVEAENGFLMSFGFNFERALRKVRKEKEAKG